MFPIYSYIRLIVHLVVCHSGGHLRMFGSSNDVTFMPRRGQLSGLYDQCREEDQLSS